MTRRIITALLSAVAVFASILIAAPAQATTPINHGDSFTGVEADSQPVMAISANGERVVVVSTPRAIHGCQEGSAAFVMQGGVVQSGATYWDAHQEWLESAPGAPCASAQNVQVALADDGTSGIVVWNAIDPDTQQWAVRFANISWTSGAYPVISQNNLMFSAGAWGWPNYEPFTGVALSLDGSRAVVAWAKNIVNAQNNPLSSTVSYSVIDMDNPASSTQQVMPGGTYPGRTEAPDVAISADGSVVMMSRPGSPNQTVTSEFRIARVFTCSHNCYPTRLKKFEASVSAGDGGSNLEARMNLAGDRIALAWTRVSAAHKVVAGVFNPQAKVPSATTTNINSRVKVISDSPAGTNPLVFAMNESGTKLAHTAVGTNSTRIVTAAITPALAVASASVSDAYPSELDGVSTLGFVNATASSPERLAVTTETTDAQTLATVSSVRVSDASLKPTNWAEIYSTSIVQGGWFTSAGFASARSAARFVAFTSTVIYSQDTFSYSYVSNAVVGVLQNVLSVTTKPSLAGTGAYNKALTLNPGKWNTGATVSYVWKRDGVILDPQPTGTKYTPLADEDMGVRMSAMITVTKPGYYDVIFDSPASAVMNGKPIRLVILIQGMTAGNSDVPVVGNTLSYSNVGSVPFLGLGIVSTVWKVGTRTVSSEGNYVVQAADVGKKISLTLKTSFANWASTTATVTSKAVIAAE